MKYVMRSIQLHCNNAYSYFIQFFDDEGEPGSIRCSFRTFFEAIYFNVVTVMAIGFGEIHATNEYVYIISTNDAINYGYLTLSFHQVVERISNSLYFVFIRYNSYTAEHSAYVFDAEVNFNCLRDNKRY